jgi:hypothetical protein
MLRHGWKLDGNRPQAISGASVSEKPEIVSEMEKIRHGAGFRVHSS